MSRMKKGVIIGAIVVIGGGYFWWSKNSSSNSAGATQYTTAAVEKGTISASVSGSGNVTVDQQATIDPTISGTVTGLSVSVGDAVKKGQVLFSIENDQLDVSLANASASLKQAENAVFAANISKDQARDAYKTRTGTALNKNILTQKIESARAGIVIAEQNLVAAKLSYQKTRDDASKRRVVSPIDGTVNEINIKNGDDLGSNSSSSSKVTPIIVSDLSTVKASISVNEVDISKVALGQKAMMTFSALDGLALSGTVEKMDSLGTIASGIVTYTVTLGFDAPDERVKPGMSVSASIICDVKSDTSVVPNSAVKTDASGTYVQILSDNVPERNAVEVGLSNSTSTEILKGLDVGEKVVTKTTNANATTTNTSSGSSGVRIPGLGGR
ncbi:MAG: efflux RND transporter periplasmic adaptor subunit [Candidatus Moraniibacteriota bacterium]